MPQRLLLPGLVVYVGQKVIDYKESFCIFPVIIKTNRNVPPDAVAFVKQINFTDTKGGLEWQLVDMNDLNQGKEYDDCYVSNYNQLILIMIYFKNKQLQKEIKSIREYVITIDDCFVFNQRNAS